MAVVTDTTTPAETMNIGFGPVPSPVMVHRDRGKSETVTGVIPFDVNATKASGAGGASVVTLAAPVAQGANSTLWNVVRKIHYSYSAAPTGGGLTIAEGALTLFQLDITGSGYGTVDFSPALQQPTANTPLTITLLAGGGSVVSKLNVEATIGE